MMSLMSRIWRLLFGQGVENVIGLYRDSEETFLPAVIIFYIIEVTFFAAANWLIFLMDSTSYLVSDQANKHVERYKFLSPEIDLATYHENAKDNMPITISEFSARLKPGPKPKYFQFGV